MAGEGTARALTMLEIRMTLDFINRWLEAIQSGHHILQHELERQFKSRPNHRQILYELAQQQLITPVVFCHLLTLVDDMGRIQRFSPVASMVPHRPDGVQSTAAAASMTASIHSQGVASSPSTTTTPPPPAAVQAPTTPASTPTAATRSASIIEVDHGAANDVPHMDVPLTTKSLATSSTYLPTGTQECSVADAVQLVSGPRHAIAANKEDDPHELITHVGGVSLFLEPCVEPVEVVFSESHLMEQLPASRVSRQWDPGIQLGYWWVLFQYFQEYLQSSLDPKVCANISKNDHLLDDITPCQDSVQQGICRSGSMVHLKVPQLATRKYESVGVDGQFYLVVGNSFALVMYCSCQSAFVYVSAFFQWEIAWLLRLGCHLSAIRYPLPLMVLCSASSATLRLVVLSSSDLVFVILVREVQGAVQMDRYILEEHMAIILFQLLKLTQEADGKRIFDLLTLNKRFEQLVNSHRVILFMKGNPEQQRCGFSRKEVDILKQEGVEFGSFDILADNEVREGMKRFSNWPTFPQLYCKGELLGGCDIVIARHESGELKDVLKEHNIPLRPQGSKIEKPVTSESANEKRPETIGLTEAQKARLENLTNSNTVMIFIKVHPRSPSVDSVGRSFIFLRKKIISATARWTNSKVSKLTAFYAQGRTAVCHHVSKPLLDVKHLFPSICRLIDITRPWDPGTSWFRLSSLLWNSDLIETASRPTLSASHCLRASNVLWGR